MESKRFSTHSIKKFDIEQEGGTLHIKGVYPLPEKINYSDNDSVAFMATKAVKTADGFYSLIKNNCNTSSPNISSSERLEMYLALSGLACEIYMKSIIYYENRHGGKQCRGHKLNELFELIPDAYKTSIRNKLPELEKSLPAIGSVFEDLRYDYELNHIEGNYLLLFDLMEELKIISDSYPKKTVGEMRFANGVLAFE